MTAFARRTLRPRFLSADLGITGVNLGVAETGTLLTVTNEGNGRLTAGAPPVHVAVMGMERVVANWAEADLLLALLARAGAGVSFATYVNCVTGPRRATELDGPEELHLVIVDNGRSNILGSPSQEALNCIRCGACLNACPVYRQIGGHAYGDVYSGPIGAVDRAAAAGHAGGPRALARLLAVRRLLEGVPGRDPAARAAARGPREPRRRRARRSGAPGPAPGRARAPSPSPAPPPACARRRLSSRRPSATGPSGRELPHREGATFRARWQRGEVLDDLKATYNGDCPLYETFMEREAFLGRLRAAAGAAAPPATAHPPGPPPATVPRVTFPADGRSLEARFGAALAAIRGRLVTLEELPAVLAELEVRTAVVTDERLPLDGIERLPLERARGGRRRRDRRAWRRARRPGTVVVAPSATETRMASLLPRVHVVAVPREVLVETPGDVLRELPRWFPDGLPSAFALASGPEQVGRHRRRGDLRRARPAGRRRRLGLAPRAV